ncbi:MAG: hypothetical protein U0527_05345 [Candidatus Eisenbacteria bacterium]
MLALLLALPLGGCRFVSTPLARVVRDPARFHGQEVTLAGRVEAVRWRPELGMLAFRLVDGSDSLLVLSAVDAPSSRGKQRLVGELLRSFEVEGQTRPVLMLRAGRGGANGGPNGGAQADTR